MDSLEGLFEIHITVSTSKMLLFRLFCLDNMYKPICASSTEMVDQVMLSKFTRGSYIKAITKMKEIESQIKEFDASIEIVRSKIEARSHDCTNIPQFPSTLPPQCYFEYHLKYQAPTSSIYKKLNDVVTSFKGARTFVSCNMFKREVEPLVTVRIPGRKGFKMAEDIKNQFMNWMKLHDFKTHSRIESEFSVYDSNLILDAKL